MFSPVAGSVNGTKRTAFVCTPTQRETPYLALMALYRHLVGIAALLIAVGAMSGCGHSPPPAAPGAALTTTVAPGCPPVAITPGKYVSIDFVDFLVHNGIRYVAHQDASLAMTPGQLGSELFRVTCTFSSLNDRTLSELPHPTEHSAAFIQAGSPVFSVRGWPAECRLAAERDGRWVAYVARVDGAETSTFNECGLEPLDQ